MSFLRLKAIIKKEFKHLFRDIRLLMILLLFPVFLLIMFGYAVNFDVRDIKIAIYDQDRSDESNDFIKSLTATDYFILVEYLNEESQVGEMLSNKIAQCVVVIPVDFSNSINRNQQTEIQYLIDGVDGNTANIIQGYVEGATIAYSSKLLATIQELRGMKPYRPVAIEPIFWYNPDLKTTRFLVPGLIGMILVITATVSVSLTLVREREQGTQEQINVSPINSKELLLGKIMPYLFVALVNAAFILLFSYLVFDVYMKGSYSLLFLSTLLFLFACTSMGIFVSSISNSQQIAFTVGTFLSLLPSLILSGFIFQIESMPKIIQILTNITPVKFYINAIRAIMLRGVGISAFWDELIYMSVFALILLVLSSTIYNIKLNRV